MPTQLSEQYLQRFGGIGRLYGQQALQALAQAHFMVIGLGGVGSWVAEALARSGIGEISLMDMDDVCITNTNRQLPAMDGAVGQSKVAVLAERLRLINPELVIHEIDDFLDADNIPEYITPAVDMVVDAIDAANVKSALVAYCSRQKRPLVMVGSAGGKTDPRQITSDDLAKVTGDPMLNKVKQQLYRWHNFAKTKNRRFRVEAVYSTEQAVFPQPDGEVCQQKSSMVDGVKLDCAGGFGAATMMTGSMGFVAADRAIKRFLQKQGA